MAPEAAHAGPSAISPTAVRDASRLTFHGLPWIENDYHLGDQIARGTYGLVVRAKHRKTGAHYAIKLLSLKRHGKDSSYDPLHELSVMRDLSHPNIVGAVDVGVHLSHNHGRMLAIVMPLARGCLWTDMCNKTLWQRRSMARRTMHWLLRALRHMHERGWAHYDVKPSNLVFTPHGVAQLCDFGMARRPGEGARDGFNVVTRWYRAPEILLHSPDYDEAADVWAAGVIAYELLFDGTPFRSDSEAEHLGVLLQLYGRDLRAAFPDIEQHPDFAAAAVAAGQDPLQFQWAPSCMEAELRRLCVNCLSPEAAKGAFDLLHMALDVDPARRATAAELLDHPWMTLTTQSLATTI